LSHRWSMAVPCLWRRTDGSTGSEIPNAIALDGGWRMADLFL